MRAPQRRKDHRGCLWASAITELGSKPSILIPTGANSSDNVPSHCHGMWVVMVIGGKNWGKDDKTVWWERGFNSFKSFCQIVLSLGFCAPLLSTEEVIRKWGDQPSWFVQDRRGYLDMGFKVLKTRTVLGKSGQVCDPVKKPITFSMVWGRQYSSHLSLSPLVWDLKKTIVTEERHGSGIQGYASPGSWDEPPAFWSLSSSSWFLLERKLEWWGPAPGWSPEHTPWGGYMGATMKHCLSHLASSQP